MAERWILDQEDEENEQALADMAIEQEFARTHSLSNGIHGHFSYYAQSVAKSRAERAGQKLPPTFG